MGCTLFCPRYIANERAILLLKILQIKAISLVFRQKELDLLSDLQTLETFYM